MLDLVWATWVLAKALGFIIIVWVDEIECGCHWA